MECLQSGYIHIKSTGHGTFLAHTHKHTQILIYVEYSLYIIEGLTEKKFFYLFNVYEDFLSRVRHDCFLFH